MVGPTSADVARTLELIGFARQRKGEYEKAADPIRRADQIQRAIDPEHPDYVQTLNLQAQQLWFEGRLQESRLASERALGLAERTLRGDHPTVARALRYLAGTLANLGDLAQSREFSVRALGILEREFGPGHYETAAYLNSVAGADFELGDYAAARARFERARETFEAHFGPWHDGVATTRLNLAIVDAHLGDYEAARREHARAIAIWERTLGANHPYVARGLTDLAVVYREQGRPAEALPLLERALAIRRRIVGTEHRDVARTLEALSATLQQLGQNARAYEQGRNAVLIWEQQHEPYAPDFATALTQFARLELRRGAVVDARRYFERALAIREKVFGPAHPAFADAQAGLALTLAASGDMRSAVDAAASAEDVSRSHLRLTLAHLPERQSLSYAANRPKGLDLILSLVGSIPDAEVRGLDAAIRSRAMVLDEMAARRGAGLGQDSPAALSAERFALARQRLANLIVRGPGEIPAARYAELVEEARNESEAAERTFAEQSAEFRAERSRARIGLQEVAAGIPPDSALVSFVRYDRTIFPMPVAGPGSSVGTRPALQEVPSYVAFVVRPGASLTAIPLGGAGAIERLVAEWRRGIAAAGGGSTNSPVPVRSSRVSGAALRKQVWDPVANHLDGVVRLFIVPDGALSLVPFAALPVGTTSYLLETGPVIHYLSAERDIVPASGESAKRGLLAVGGASFDDQTALDAGSNPATLQKPTNTQVAVRGAGQICGGLSTITFPPLPGTLQEVRELSDLWTTRANAGAAAEPVRSLMGRDASEVMFKQQAHRYRILHVATHGFFLSDSCSIAPSGTRAVGGLTTVQTFVENPLHLSGLAFAGANRRAKAGNHEEDGILTAEEVAALNLEGVEWAVLSGCDTGVGEIRAGEGVLGLRRAFQVAGARTVVMSLWSVGDQAARAWMRALYDGRFRAGLSTADAVHQASLARLRERRAKGQSTNPFHWGAFVAAGDWK